MIINYKISEFLANKELAGLQREAELLGNHRFILKYKPLAGELALFVAEQNRLKEKFKNKLPFFTQSQCLLTERAAEQCTAEAVANYKATLMKGHKGLVLAGGLGIDEWALAQNAEKIVSIDTDETLNRVVSYNYEMLNISNIERITDKAEDFITNTDIKFDYIYTDPDRRADDKRQILLRDHQPDIIAMLPRLLEISNEVWIKCSPLYDIAMALQEVPGISHMYCISYKGEVKEMLLKVTRQGLPSPLVTCTDINNTTIEKTFSVSQQNPEPADAIEGYFYEAGNTLVKTRLFNQYAAELGLRSISQNIPFFCSDKVHENFMGKCLQINAVMPLNPKQMKAWFKSNNIRQVNIKNRGTKTDTAQLLKTSGLKEGGNDFLFICPFNNKNLAVYCSPLPVSNL